MKLSCFTPLGLLRLSGEKPVAQSLYEDIRANLGGQFDMTEGSRWDAKAFAMARGVARARNRLRQAALQRLPAHVSETMPIRENELGIIPGALATMSERRAEYAARFMLQSGGTKINIELALETLLGDGFVAYQPTTLADTVTWSQSDGLDINYQLPGVSRKAVTLSTPISLPSVTAQWVDYELLGAPLGVGEDPYVVAGDVLLVEPGRLGLMERLTVVDAETSPSPRFQAVFTRSHDAGSLALSHPYPGESTTKRHALIIVTQAVAGDPEKRRQINELLRRLVRSTSTWDIVEQDPASLGETKLFQIGEPSIGRRTLTTVSI